MQVIRRGTRILLEILAGVGAALVVVTAIAGLRLSQGPIGLPFLEPYLEEALSAADGSFVTSIGGAGLVWSGWSRGLDTQITDLRITDGTGRDVGAVPVLAVEFSLRALLRAEIAIKAVQMRGAELRIVRGGDGQFRLAGISAANGVRLPFTMTEILAVILAPPDRASPIGYLTELQVFDARVDVEDVQTGLIWLVEGEALKLERVGAGVTGDFALDLSYGEGVASLRGDFSYARAGEQATFQAEMTDLVPAGLLAGATDDHPLAGIDLPMRGQAEGRIDGRTGQIALSFELSASPGRVDLPDVFVEPLPVEALALRGNYDSEAGILRLGDGFLDLSGPTATFSGSTKFRDDGMLLTLNATISDVPVADLSRLWPRHGPGRDWVTHNVSDGRLKGLSATAEVLVAQEAFTDSDADQDAADRLQVLGLSGSFDYDGLVIRFMETMPPVRDISGQGRLGVDRIDFEIDSGRLESIQLTQSTVALTGLDDTPGLLVLDSFLSGDVPAVLAVLDNAPIHIGGTLGALPAETSGDFTGSLSASMPLKKSLSFEEVSINASLETDGLVLPRTLNEVPLTEGTLNIGLDNEKVTYSGSATFADRVLDLTGQRYLGDARAYRGQRTLSGRFSEAIWSALNVDVAPVLDGPAEIRLTETVFDDGASEIELSADLEAATLKVPGVEWSKSAGVPGTAQASLRIAPDGQVAIRGFTLEGDDFHIEGSAGLNRKHELAYFEGPQLRFGRTNMMASVRRNTDGGYRVILSGDSIDVSELINSIDDEGAYSLPPLNIAARLDKLFVGPGEALDDGQGRLHYDGTTWDDIEIGAKTPGQGLVSYTIRPSTDGRTMSLRADNAGALIRSLGIWDRISGGRLEVSGQFGSGAGAGEFKGKVLLNDYLLTDAPRVAQILQAASLYGILNMLGERGIRFTRLSADLSSKDGLMTVENGQTAGPDLGLTFGGFVDPETDRIDLRGVIVPAYAINSLLGNIPIVGDVLMGGEGGGIFAANYQLSGSLEEPKTSVNPLSALAPGFLRGLFNIMEPKQDASRPAANGAPPSPGIEALPTGPPPEIPEPVRPFPEIPESGLPASGNDGTPETAPAPSPGG